MVPAGRAARMIMIVAVIKRRAEVEDGLALRPDLGFRQQQEALEVLVVAGHRYRLADLTVAASKQALLLALFGQQVLDCQSFLHYSSSPRLLLMPAPRPSP